MAFKIHGEVSLDGAMFKRGLQEVGEESTAFLKNFALGAIGIASVEQALSKTIESAEELVNTSKNLDLTVEQLQVLRQAAEENGKSFETMTKALEKFNAVRENILTGGKGSAAQIAALQRLGIDRDTLTNQTGAQSLMGQISETARKSNAADVANDLKTVFGKGGDEIFGVLKTDFVELQSKMQNFGMIMDSTTAHELKNFKEEMALTSKIFEANFAPVLVLFGKALFEVVAALGALGTGMGSWLAVVGDMILHPLAYARGKGTFSGHMGDEIGQDVLNYWKSKQAEFDEIFNKKPEEPKPPAVSLPENESTKKQKEIREKEIKSDSLIAVGNFLGAGRDAISSIAQDQLDVARQQLDTLNRIETKLDAGGSTNDNTIDIED